MSLYEDSTGRRLVDIEGERDPTTTLVLQAGLDRSPPESVVLSVNRRVRLADLVETELLSVGDELVWKRRNLGHEYHGTITPEGSIRLESGATFSSPSRAAMEAAGMGSYDGWNAWKVPRLESKLLSELRAEFEQMSDMDD